MELGDLIKPSALLNRAVEIGVFRHLHIAHRLHKGAADRAGEALIAHLQGAVRPMQRAGAGVAFGFQEIGQHRGPIPPSRPQIRPDVVIRRMAAHIKHGVDGRGAPQRLAPWLKAPPPVQARLWRGVQGPVVNGRAARDHGGHKGRRADEDIAAHAAGLDQADRHGGVFGQSCGQHASGRPTTADDIVKLHGASLSLPHGKANVTLRPSRRTTTSSTRKIPRRATRSTQR